MLDNNTVAKHQIWLNAHAFAENILNQGRVLQWHNPIEFAENYKKIQGVVGADRLSVPLMGFLDYWVEHHPHVLQTMAGKNRVRYAIKKLLTNETLRAELSELVGACCAMVGCEILLELPSNSALISWAHGIANPGQEVQGLTDLDIDSTSVYLADTVRQLKASGIAGVVTTLSDVDVAAGAEVEHYQPLINVANNYHWLFAFRRPLNTVSHTFNSKSWYCLGDDDCSELANLTSLGVEFWQDASAAATDRSDWYYAELPAFVEPELVRKKIAELRNLD
jgi:hypothetical protein